MQAEGRIETTDFQEIFCWDDTFGLDTAELHRLLDQRFAAETDCQVTSISNQPEAEDK